MWQDNMDKGRRAEGILTIARDRQDRLFRKGMRKIVGLDLGPGPRQFNKLGGVWIFLISRRSWMGGRAWSSCRNVGGRRVYFKSSNARLGPLGYSCHARRSALNASDLEGRVSIGVEAPLRESLAVFATAVPSNVPLNDLIVISLSILWNH